MRHWMVVVVAMIAAPAWAGPREDSLAGITRCAGLPDDRTFLDCVYGAVQPLRAQLGLQPAPLSQQRLVPPASPAPAQSPPGAAPARRSEEMLAVRNGGALHMASYRFDSRGLFTVTLDDGSVWKQDANDTNFAHFGGQASRYAVTLLAGDYGKSRLSVRGEPGLYLVERAQ